MLTSTPLGCRIAEVVDDVECTQPAADEPAYAHCDLTDG